MSSRSLRRILVWTSTTVYLVALVLFGLPRFVDAYLAPLGAGGGNAQANQLAYATGSALASALVPTVAVMLVLGPVLLGLHWLWHRLG